MGAPMTEEEAKIIARIVSTADSGCETCVESLCGELNSAKLGWSWALDGQLCWSRPYAADPEEFESFPVVRVSP